MSTVQSPIDTEPVGHQRAHVDITQRPSLAVTGWLGVLCSSGLSGGSWSRPTQQRVAVDALVFVLVITPLVIVTPGQISVVFLASSPRREF